MRVDVFVSPRWSFGVAYGRDLRDADDRELSVYLSGHLRALDGMY